MRKHKSAEHQRADEYFEQFVPTSVDFSKGPKILPADFKWKYKFDNCCFCATRIRSSKTALFCLRCNYIYCKTCRGPNKHCVYCEMEKDVQEAKKNPNFQLPKEISFVVIGLGISGCCTAIALAKRGYKVTILEKQPTLDELTSWPGAITINQPSIIALNEISPDVCQHIKKTGRIANNFLVWATWDNKPRLVFNCNDYCSRYNLPDAYTTARSHLMKALIEAVKDCKISILLGKEFIDTKESTDGSCCVNFVSDGGDIESLNADFVIGADGVSSTVRKHFFTEKQPNNIGMSTIIGQLNDYEFDLPAVNMGEVWGKKDGAHFLLAAVSPQKDGKADFCWSLQISKNHQLNDNTEELKREVLDNFSAYFPAGTPFIKDIIERTDRIYCPGPFREAPRIGSYVSYGDQVILVGDAAHAMGNQFGFGAGSGIEDACALGEMLDVCLARTLGHDRLSKEEAVFVVLTAMQRFDKRRFRRAERIKSTSKTLRKIMLTDFPPWRWILQKILKKTAQREICAKAPLEKTEALRSTFIDHLFTTRTTFKCRMNPYAVPCSQTCDISPV